MWCAGSQKVLGALHDVQLALPDAPPPAQADAVADIRAQLARLMPAGFVAVAGVARFGDLARYLTAVARRLERLPHGLTADRDRMLGCPRFRTPTTASSRRCHRPAPRPPMSATSRG